jgi:transposase-like protein
MTYDLAYPAFADEDAAREALEASRWPNGPVCPYCKQQEPVRAFGGKSMGKGWFHCNDCRRKFTVRVGTLYERSHIPLSKWLLATHLLTSSKKGMSTHQLHRMLGVTYKTAWFMTHRIREARSESGSAPIGGEGKVVEADETYFGKIEGPIRHSRKRYNWSPTKGGLVGPAGKLAVLALVQRGGEARMFHLATPDKATVEKIVRENVAKEARLYTDESRLYGGSADHFTSHDTVKHSAGEYVRYEDGRAIHSNTVEGVFSVFKRGMKGVYQHCKEKHLHRYLAEFEFRYNNRTALGVTDKERAAKAIKGIEGKRLTYRRIDRAAL